MDNKETISALKQDTGRLEIERNEKEKLTICKWPKF